LAVAGQCNVVYALFLNCTFTSCTVAALNWSAVSSTANTSLYMFGCLFNGNAQGIILTQGQQTRVNLVNCVIYNSTSHGVYMDTDAGNYADPVLYLDNCALVSNGGSGVYIGSGGTAYPHVTWCFDTVFSNNTGYGINYSQVAGGAPAFGHQLVGRSNAYYNNSLGQINNAANTPGDVTLSADPFTSASGLNFSLNGTAGGGAACKAAGWPTTIPGS
jgi:hypothetical protein